LKTIVILSPDTWGKMMLSKMHYAKTLAEEGNRVFFINPPRKESASKVWREEDNLTVVSLKERPLRIFSREKLKPLYRKIEKKYVKEIKRITGSIDELWCFNAFFISDIKFFGAAKTLLLVYDLYVPENLRKAAVQADGIVSVANEILNEFKEIQKPELLVHHGLAPAFEKMAKSISISQTLNQKIKIGYVGNLMRQSIDRTVFKHIINGHPDIEFHFWGPTEVIENNLITDHPEQEVTQFIEFLRGAANILLHGVKSPDELADGMPGMDAFLFLYDAKQDVNAGFNSHKLTEYLATGKTVISPYISRFDGSGLMIMDKKGSEDFTKYFDDHIEQIEEYNRPELQQKRITFALDNTYKKQVERIRAWMDTLI